LQCNQIIWAAAGSQRGGSGHAITHPETQASDPLPAEAASAAVYMMSRQDRSAVAAHETTGLLRRMRTLAVQQTPVRNCRIGAAES